MDTCLQHRVALLAACLIPAFGLDANAAETPAPWPDTPLARTQALALLQTLNATLLSQPSATLTLERWCADHRLASEPRIVAQRDRAIDKPPTDEVRAALAIARDEPIRYRRVRLACGERVLSEADNWYVPSRLAPEMNDALDTSDMPFGKAVQALGFRRQTLSAEVLWSPLPDGWETGDASIDLRGALLDVPSSVLRHRALLYRRDNVPFSVVVETYTGAVFDFPHSTR